VTLVDANILLYAEDSSCEQHERARTWWDDQLSGDAPVCLCWTVLLAFIRIATNKKVFEVPLTLKEAIARVQGWLDQPCVRLIDATSRHWELFQVMALQGQALANLTTDAHLAALALEYNGTLYSTDADFSRFPGLKWKNPLAA
jgi:hypothetical protein